MQKFRRKPTEVEAFQYLPKPGLQAFFDMQNFVGKALVPYMLDPSGHTIGIQTVAGMIHVYPGYWVIKETTGEFHSCGPEFFELNYVKVVPLQPRPVDPELLAQLPEDDDET